MCWSKQIQLFLDPEFKWNIGGIIFKPTIWLLDKQQQPSYNDMSTVNILYTQIKEHV